MLRPTEIVNLVLVTLLAGACAGDLTEEHEHHAAPIVYEGDAIAALFAGGTSAPLRVGADFRRVGLLWDAIDDGALEIRTSADGGDWSWWTAPTVVSSEEPARAGHLDVADDSAAWLQLRVVAGKAVPTFLAIEPLAEIPPPVVPDETIVDDIDARDMAVGPWFSDTQSTPIGSITIYSRADWGARAPNCSSATSPTRATIHHTVGPINDSMTPQARLRQIQNYHMDSLGWCDIGYNYVVSRDGRVWRARGPTTLGAHVSNNNSGNVGVAFIGTYTSTTATATQMCSTAKLLRRLHEGYGITLARWNIKGHRQYLSTACPGNALYNQIDAIVRKSNQGCQVN